MLTDFRITQLEAQGPSGTCREGENLEAQGPSRTCNESKEEVEEEKRDPRCPVCAPPG